MTHSTGTDSLQREKKNAIRAHIKKATTEEVIKILQWIAKGQTEDEQRNKSANVENARGFSRDEAASTVVSEVLARLKNGEDLSKEQIRETRKICMYHARQLLNFNYYTEDQIKAFATEYEETKEPSLTDKIIQIALDGCEFIHNQYNETYAVVNRGANKSVIKLRSREFKYYIGKLYFDAEGKGLTKDAFSSALITLEGEALYDGEERFLYNRVANLNGKIYYDMADKECRIIEIDSNGWRFVTDSPVLFAREQHQKAQIEPIRNGDINKLWNYIGLNNNYDKHGMLPCIVTTFIQTIDHVIIVICGSQGSGKSFTSEILKELIDPSSTKTRALSKKEADLILSLYHNWFCAFDNISDVLKQWQSDILARASTGGGVTKRMLYADDDEIIYNIKRGILLNGMIIPLTQPDIMDRSIIFRLKRFASPLSKEMLEERFKRDRPEIFGALLDLLSKAIKIEAENDIKIPPGLRMYDFAKWAEATSQAIGNEKDVFLTYYLNKKTDDNYEVIQSSKIGYVLSILITEDAYTVHDNERDDNKKTYPFFDDDKKWKGTPTDLLKILNWKASDGKIDKRSDWVDSPEALSREIGKLKTNFRATGVEIEIGREHKGRFINIFKIIDESTPEGEKKRDTSDTGDTKDGDGVGRDGCDA